MSPTVDKADDTKMHEEQKKEREKKEKEQEKEKETGEEDLPGSLQTSQALPTWVEPASVENQLPDGALDLSGGPDLV